VLCLLQRVTRASVTVEHETIAAIDAGLLVLVGVERGDTTAQAERMAERLLAYRVFEDDAGKMNLSLAQTGGGLLLVPQFTLPANTAKGNRPSFARAAPPQVGAALFEELLSCTRRLHGSVGSGQFGANMQVALVNDGPVTLMLKVAPAGE
jgi:D-tyrosyl-tRNA(Tyr) deacylase